MSWSNGVSANGNQRTLKFWFGRDSTAVRKRFDRSGDTHRVLRTHLPKCAPSRYFARSTVEVAEGRYVLDEGSSRLVERRETAAIAIGFKLGPDVLDEVVSRAVRRRG